MTLYGLLFRWFGWFFGGALALGTMTPWRDGRVDAASRFLGVGILLLWGWHWWVSLRDDAF